MVAVASDEAEGEAMSESKSKMQQAHDDLLGRLDFALTQRDRLEAENTRLTQVLLVPTDAMLDSVRPIISYCNGKLHYGDMRRHVQNSGHTLEGWPAWAREAPDNAHINKASMASIIWAVMAAKALKP